MGSRRARGLVLAALLALASAACSAAPYRPPSFQALRGPYNGLTEGTAEPIDAADVYAAARSAAKTGAVKVALTRGTLEKEDFDDWGGEVLIEPASGEFSHLRYHFDVDKSARPRNRIDEIVAVLRGDGAAKPWKRALGERGLKAAALERLSVGLAGEWVWDVRTDSPLVALLKGGRLYGFRIYLTPRKRPRPGDAVDDDFRRDVSSATLAYKARNRANMIGWGVDVDDPEGTYGDLGERGRFLVRAVREHLTEEVDDRKAQDAYKESYRKKIELARQARGPVAFFLALHELGASFDCRTVPDRFPCQEGRPLVLSLRARFPEEIAAAQAAGLDAVALALRIREAAAFDLKGPYAEPGTWRGTGEHRRMVEKYGPKPEVKFRAVGPFTGRLALSVSTDLVNLDTKGWVENRNPAYPKWARENELLELREQGILRDLNEMGTAPMVERSLRTEGSDGKGNHVVTYSEDTGSTDYARRKEFGASKAALRQELAEVRAAIAAHDRLKPVDRTWEQGTVKKTELASTQRWTGTLTRPAELVTPDGDTVQYTTNVDYDSRVYKSRKEYLKHSQVNRHVTEAEALRDATSFVGELGVTTYGTKAYYKYKVAKHGQQSAWPEQTTRAEWEALKIALPLAE